MASAIKPTRKYPSGADFVKYTPEGGSFAFYPSGRMAAAYERMGSGFYCYFYADNKVGTTLSAFSPDGCGYVAFENNSKPRLTSTKTGGTSVNAEGLIDRSWTESKPLKSPIEISVTKNIVFRYANRRQITASLTCQGLTEEYILGDPPDRMDSYLQKSIGVVKMGPERGKQILDVDRCREAADAAREKREAFALKELGPSKKGHITQDFMQKHSQLRDIVRATDDLKASVREGKWNVEVFNNKSQLAATLGDSLPTLQLDPALMKGDPHSRLLTGMAATQPDTLEALLKDSVFDNRVLPLSNALKGASGRYRAALVVSRCFTMSDGDTFAFVPFLDMADHEAQPTANFASDARGFVLKALRPIAAGEPVSICYGEDYTSRRLFEQYGFCPEQGTAADARTLRELVASAAKEEASGVASAIAGAPATPLAESAMGMQALGAAFAELAESPLSTEERRGAIFDALTGEERAPNTDDGSDAEPSAAPAEGVDPAALLAAARWQLTQFPTSLLEDEQLLRQLEEAAESAAVDGRVYAVLSYRLARKRLLAYTEQVLGTFLGV